MPKYNLAAMQAAADQDRAECDRWWQNASAEDKLRVWEAIQRECDDPVAEVMSRFAQLAMTDCALRCHGDGPARVGDGDG